MITIIKSNIELYKNAEVVISMVLKEKEHAKYCTLFHLYTIYFTLPKIQFKKQYLTAVCSKLNH